MEGWRYLTTQVPPSRPTRRDIGETHAARQAVTLPPTPALIPEQILEELDRWTQRIYGGRRFTDLKTPFARLVVNLAAFHPGAQLLVEKYGPDVLKSRRLWEYLLPTVHTVGVHTGIIGKGLKVGDKYVSAGDLTVARKQGMFEMNEKAVRVLQEAGLPSKSFPQWILSLLGGVFLRPQQGRLHPYTLVDERGRKVTVLLPETPGGATALAHAVGELGGTGVLALAASPVAGIFVRGGGLAATAARGALTGLQVGAARQLAREGLRQPPARIAEAAVTEAAFWGAVPVTGAVAGAIMRRVPGALRAGIQLMERHPRLASALSEAAVMGLTEMGFVGAESLIERQPPVPHEVLSRVAWASALGFLVGGLSRVETTEDLARLMKAADRAFAEGIEKMMPSLAAEQRIQMREGFRRDLVHRLSSGDLATLAQYTGVEPRRRAWTPAQVQKAANIAFEPLPKPAPPAAPPPTPVEAPPEAAPTPTPTPPQPETVWRDMADRIAEEAFAEGRRGIQITRVAKALKGVPTPQGMSRTEFQQTVWREASERLAERWTRAVRDYEHYEALVNELFTRARNEGRARVDEAFVEKHLSDPKLQQEFLPHKGWRARISEEGVGTLVTDINARLESVPVRVPVRREAEEVPVTVRRPVRVPVTTEITEERVPVRFPRVPIEFPEKEAVPIPVRRPGEPPPESPPTVPERPPTPPETPPTAPEAPPLPQPDPQRARMVEVDAPEIAKKDIRVVVPQEPAVKESLTEGKTDLTTLEEQLGREILHARVTHYDAQREWWWLEREDLGVKVRLHMPKGQVPEFQPNDHVVILFPPPVGGISEGLARGTHEWHLLQLPTPEGKATRVWVYKPTEMAAEDIVKILIDPQQPPSAPPSRRRGAVINPFSWLGRLWEQNVLADDIVPTDVDVTRVKSDFNRRMRVWLHFRSPQQVAMRAKSPGVLEFFDRATERGDELRRQQIKHLQLANQALNGLTHQEAITLSYALQDQNIYNALPPNLKWRADILRAIHQELGQLLSQHGYRVRQGFDFTHMLWGDEVVTIRYKDKNGDQREIVLGTYETYDEAIAAAVNKIESELRPQGATDFRVEVFYQRHLPADAWVTFDRMPLERLLQGIERLARQDQLAMETYARYLERTLNEPDLVNPNSPRYDAQLHQAAQELLRWLQGEIDNLPHGVLNDLRTRLGLRPAPAPWWTGQRSLNLETYERDLRAVVPSYINSVYRTVYNRAMRMLERDVLGKYPDMPLQEQLYLRDYRDALTGGTYWLAMMDRFLATIGIPKPQRWLAYISSYAAIKFLGLNPAKWLLNRTQPYMFAGPMVGLGRVVEALPKMWAAARGHDVTINGITYKAEELWNGFRLDVQDLRYLVGAERFLGPAANKVTEILMMPFTSAEVPNRLQVGIAGIDWGLGILRPWLTNPERRAALANGQPGPMSRDEAYLWQRFRHLLPQWAARIEAGESVDAVLKDAGLAVGRWVIDTTQFRQDITDVPLFVSKGGQFGRTMFQFMNFAVKQLEFLFSPGTTPETKLKAFALLMGGAGLLGMPLFDELDEALRRVTDGKVSIKRTLLLRAADPSNPERTFYKFLLMGLPSLAGIDWSQSLGVPLWQFLSRFGIVTEQRQAAYPGLEEFVWQSWLRTSPGASWIMDTVTAAIEYARTPTDQTFRRFLYALLPVGVARMLQSFYTHQEGVFRTTVKGKPLLREIDAWVTVPLALGFMPERVATARRLLAEIQRETQEATAERSQLAAQIADLTAKGWKEGLTPEESQRLDELLQRFGEMGGDARQIDAHLQRLMGADLQVLIPSVPRKDIERSPILQELVRTLQQITGR